MTGNVITSMQLNGASVSGVFTLDVPNAQQINTSVAVGWAGSLTTRTDANTGTITMTDAGHLITTGARACIFWTDSTGAVKCQHKVTIGTVSGTSVPFDSGVGDNLPVLATAVVIGLDTEIDYTFLDANLEAIGVGGTAAGKVVLEKADGTVVFHKTLGVGGNGFVWAEESGASIPVSDDVAKAFIANGSSSTTNTITVVAGLNA